MQTTMEETRPHTVRLQVEVPPEEFKRDLDRAYRHVAGEVKIPGFRKGKAPRQVIDKMVGREHVLEHFIKDSLPSYYVMAIREHDLAPISEPEIDLDQLEEGKPLKFTATVEIRPRLELEPEQYRGIAVTAPSAEPTDREIEDYVDRLRDRFAELDTVSRPARTGDYVLADVRATVHDQEIPEATRVGFFTEVGSEELVPELDREIEGKRTGEIVKFNAALPAQFGDRAGTEVTFQALVKDVKAKNLPAADDEFAKTASEFDTLDELKADLRTKLGEMKKAEVEHAVRELVLAKAVEAVQVDLPERMVDEETQSRIEGSRERLERAGMSLEQALEAQGFDELRFRSDTRAHATRAIVADLVLEAVARREGLEVGAEDLDREIAATAARIGREPKELRRLLERSGQIGTLAGDIIRSKALDFLVESADVTTEDSPSQPMEADTVAAAEAAAEEPLTETPDETQGDQDE
jgi:trigger factor